MPEETDVAYVRSVLEAARIPRVYHDVKLLSVENGALFNDYLIGARFQEDREAGVGACVYGDARQRAAAFPVFARALAILEQSVRYTNLLWLLRVLDSDDNANYDQLMGVRALFVSDMAGPEECPFSRFQRLMIEGFLMDRREMGLRNYYSCHRPFVDCDWWSILFRAQHDPYLRSFMV